jgi:hypothetical protein
MSSPYLWEAEATSKLPVAPESVWTLWDRPARWSEWDPAIKETEFTRPLTTGTMVIVRFHRGRALRFTVIARDGKRGFTGEAELVGARVGHQHRIWSERDGIEVWHRIYFAGPLARLWGAVMGARVRRHLADLVANEKRVAWEVETA